MQAYRENLEGVQEVVLALLRLLSDRKLRATWACVGALGCANWDDYFSKRPHRHAITTLALPWTHAMPTSTLTGDSISRLIYCSS